jgi:hypothetical protein
MSHLMNSAFSSVGQFGLASVQSKWGRANETDKSWYFLWVFIALRLIYIYIYLCKCSEQSSDFESLGIFFHHLFSHRKKYFMRPNKICIFRISSTRSAQWCKNLSQNF